MTKRSTKQPAKKPRVVTPHLLAAVDPIIIDDGGSIRIRNTKGTKMDDLLDSGSTFKFPAAAVAKSLRVFTLSDAGGQTAIPSAGSQGVNPNDKIIVVSGDFQIVFQNGDGTSGSQSSITVQKSGTTNAANHVKADSHAAERRYHVSTLVARIQSVTINGSTIFTQGSQPAHFTAVLVS
jgi:hypothetical protein